MLHHGSCASPLCRLENVKKTSPSSPLEKTPLIFKQDNWFLLYLTESFGFDCSHPYFQICFSAPQEKASIKFATCPGTLLVFMERGGGGKGQTERVYEHISTRTQSSSYNSH